MHNIKTRLLLTALFFAIAFTRCTPDQPKEEEQALVTAIDPDTGSTLAKAFGSTYSFKLVRK